MQQYTIDRSHICSVQVKTVRNIYAGTPPGELTQQQTVDILSGAAAVSSYYSDDHPEFKELRDRLEADGYIKTRRNCWNGDRVIRTFSLNGWIFSVNHMFPCAAALDVALDVAQRQGKIYRSSL